MAGAKSPTATWDADPPRVDGGLVGDPLRNPHDRLERRLCERAGGLLLHGELVRLFPLREDLRLTAS